MKRNVFFIIMMLSLFLFGCHGERSGDITLIPGQSMTDFGGTYTEYESLAYVYDITPLSPPDHTPPMTFDTFPSYTGMSDPRTWVQVHGGSMIFCTDMGDEKAAAVYDLSGEYQSAVRYRSPIHGNAMFTYLDSSSCYLTAEISSSPDNTDTDCSKRMPQVQYWQNLHGFPVRTRSPRLSVRCIPLTAHGHLPDSGWSRRFSGWWTKTFRSSVRLPPKVPSRTGFRWWTEIWF